MWYVIQTKSGDEEQEKLLMEKLVEPSSYSRLFVPLYEDVRRSNGKYMLSFRRMFPGYFFVETDEPNEVYRKLRSVPGFTRLLGSEERDGEKNFIPVEPEEEGFLTSLLDEGIMHVSYIRMKNKRIDRVIGPLAGYRNHISKLDIPHRRAIVTTKMFGRERKIKFGLWLEGDPSVAWLEERMNEGQKPALDEGAKIDIGLKPGDLVKDETGLYGDIIFEVESVDHGRRTIRTSFEMLGVSAHLELNADSVTKVETK